MIKRIKVKKYEGTLEGAESLVKDMKLEKYDYYFDLNDRSVFVHNSGILIRPGDHYQVRLPEEFQTVSE